MAGVIRRGSERGAKQTRWSGGATGCWSGRRTQPPRAPERSASQAPATMLSSRWIRASNRREPRVHSHRGRRNRYRGWPHSDDSRPSIQRLRRKPHHRAAHSDVRTAAEPRRATRSLRDARSRRRVAKGTCHDDRSILLLGQACSRCGVPPSSRTSGRKVAGQVFGG